MRIYTIILPILSLLLLHSCTGQKVQQLNPTKLESSINNNEFTLVYFYSATCQYCQAFTPKFQQLAKINNVTGVVYGKIDGNAYKDLAKKYNVFSYPTIALFWKGIDEPVYYRKEREVANLLDFLRANTKLLKNYITKQRYEKLTQQQKNSGITYYGPLQSQQHRITTVLSMLQPYRPFAIYQSNTTQPSLQIKQHLHQDFNIKTLRTTIRQQFATVYSLDEQPWIRIHEEKQVGIVYVDAGAKGNDRKVLGVLGQLAKEYVDLVFLRIQPKDEQFKDAINALGVEWEENIYGVDKKYDVKFVAPRPYTEQSLRQFITQVLNLSAPIYHRSQKTTHKQKLTNENFQQKVLEQPKDVVVFLYRQNDRIHAKFMDLFKYLTQKLQNNTNISLLRCNLSKNEIELKLGFEVKITPSILYYAHRMKDRPVHYTKSVISATNVIQFIMENTTFDWEDQWGEL